MSEVLVVPAEFLALYCIFVFLLKNKFTGMSREYQVLAGFLFTIRSLSCGFIFPFFQEQEHLFGFLRSDICFLVCLGYK